VFDEVTKREGGKRAFQRVSWLAGSTALQTALVATIIVVSAAVAKRVTEGPVVPVKLVRPATPPPQAPPPPPPPAPRRKTPPKPRTEAPKPRAAMIQPKEMPQELKPPDPKEEPEPEEDVGEGVEGGVIGGVVGGVSGAPPPAPQPAGPVKFNNAMTPPVLVSAPPLEYSQQALERDIEGIMLVECVVTIEGVVQQCRVLKSLPFMDRQVVSNLERRRYKPATLGGKPLDVQYTFTVRLKLPQ
jgi:protein TonB